MSFFKTFIFKKIVMALSGLLLIGFLVTHLAGNLLIFKGADVFNQYSHALVSNPFIIVAELGLLVLFLGHLISGILFTICSKRARPESYAKKTGAGHASRRSLASISMIISGLVVLVFVFIHLKDFKYGTHYTVAGAPAGEVRDLHRLVLEEFKEPGEVIFYVVVMLLIGAHLWHGFGSAFESVGVAYRPWIRGAGKALAVVIGGGFALIPIVVYFS